MSWTSCEKCGHEQHWRAHRGARLQDLECSQPGCGGRLRGLTAGRKQGSTGKAKVCVVCGKVRYTAVKFILTTGPLDVWRGGKKVTIQVQRGDAVCWHAHGLLAEIGYLIE